MSLLPTGEHTCFAASQALQCPHWHPPLPTGSVRRVVHEKRGCNKWKKALACLLVAWCFPDHKPRSFDVEDATYDYYDPQLVTAGAAVTLTFE